MRDRFEKLINAIATVTPLTETRTRFEQVMNAVAAKLKEISESSGGGSFERTALFSGSIASITRVELSSMISNFDYIEIHWMSDEYTSLYFSVPVEVGVENDFICPGTQLKLSFPTLGSMEIKGAPSGFSITKVVGVKF